MVPGFNGPYALQPVLEDVFVGTPLLRTPGLSREGRRAIEEWRRYEPDVDLYVSPCYAVELPPEDADELEVRLPLTSFLRWVNLTGWAALAIGNLQLIAPSDEVVLAAGLAWELHEPIASIGSRMPSGPSIIE